MHQIRQHTEPDHRIVVRGAARLADVWPGERLEAVRPAIAAEVGGVDAVVALLASIEGVHPDAYRAWNPLSTVALRALAAHCRAAILEAAMRVHGDLAPEAVLTELHAGLQRPIEPLVARLAS